MFYIKDIKRKTIVATYDDKKQILEINGKSQDSLTAYMNILFLHWNVFQAKKRKIIITSQKNSAQIAVQPL